MERGFSTSSSTGSISGNGTKTVLVRVSPQRHLSITSILPSALLCFGVSQICPLQPQTSQRPNMFSQAEWKQFGNLNHCFTRNRSLTGNVWTRDKFYIPICQAIELLEVLCLSVSLEGACVINASCLFHWFIHV